MNKIYIIKTLLLKGRQYMLMYILMLFNPPHPSSLIQIPLSKYN